MKRRWLMSLAAGVLVLAAALFGLPRAAADDFIALAWDSETSLVWHSGSAVNAMGSFLGTATIVPGDRQQRTVWVRNDGPSAANATVMVRDVIMTDENGTDSDYLHKTLQLAWKVNGVGDEMSWLGATKMDTPLFEQFRVEKGEAFALTIGYHFPASATGGMSSKPHVHNLAFTVHITLTESTESSDPPDKPDFPYVPDNPPGDPGTGQTGGAVLSRWSEGLAVAVSGVVLFAILVYRNLRREERPDR